MKTIYLITTGGTIEKSFCERTGKLGNFEQKVEIYLRQIRLPHTHIELVPLLAKDSVEITAEDRQLLRDAVLERITSGSPIVMTHGTDTIVETAQYLAARILNPPVPLILTGAMMPLGFEHSDGVQNLTESLLAAWLLPAGVHLVMHNRVFDIRNVRKDREAKTFVECTL